MPDDVITNLIRINGKRIQDLRKMLAPLHYVGTMPLIVYYLHRHPGASQEEIAEYYSLDKTSVARDAHRLEEMDHISREIAPDNRRQYCLYMTLEGEAFLKTLNEMFAQFERKLSRGIDADEWERFSGTLEKIAKNCSES